MPRDLTTGAAPLSPVAIDLRQERLGGLQGLRAIAALGVVLQHAIYYACEARGIDYMRYLRIGFGGLGVDLFFVISGFVMAGCLYQGRRFLWNRIIRIYPGYWLAIVLSGLLLAGTQPNWSLTLSSLPLIPAVPLNIGYHIPYWTLVYEMGFYVLVAAMVVLRFSAAAMQRFCVVWLLAIAAVSRYNDIDIAQPGLWLWLAPHNVFFVTGMLLGLVYRHVSRLPSLPLALTAVILCTLGEILYGMSHAGAFMTMAPGLAAVVLLGIRHLRWRWLEHMGDASYGIYLSHAFIMVLCIHLLDRHAPGLSLYALFSLAMLAAVIGSALFGWCEFRLHRSLKRIGRGRRERTKS